MIFSCVFIFPNFLKFLCIQITTYLICCQTPLSDARTTSVLIMNHHCFAKYCSILLLLTNFIHISMSVFLDIFTLYDFILCMISKYSPSLLQIIQSAFIWSLDLYFNTKFTFTFIAGIHYFLSSSQIRSKLFPHTTSININFYSSPQMFGASQSLWMPAHGPCVAPYLCSVHIHIILE